MENKVVTLKTLKSINKESINRDYNRNLNWKEFQKGLMDAMNSDDRVVWSGMNTKTILTPVLVHTHKQGKSCEPHIRCKIETVGLLNSVLTLDVPSEMFENLLGIEEFLAQAS